LWQDLPIDFRPGKYYLPIGAVEIKEDGQIKVKYLAVGANLAEQHLLNAVFSHLATSKLIKFTDLIGDKGKFNEFDLVSLFQ
jgi:hypothetical protein